MRWSKKRFQDQYVVDTHGLGRDAEIAACRAALALVESDVSRFQCDVPWLHEAGWPEEVREAAGLLVSHLSDYETSGWVKDFSESQWRAYVTFAPYAYSSDAWTAEMSFLADINDLGTSVCVRVLPKQLDEFEQSVHGAGVVPLDEWRSRPRPSRY